MGVGSRLLERIRLRLDDSRRRKLTQYGNLAVEGDLTSAVEGLERVERDAFSVAVRGWAITGEAYVLLTARRTAEAEAAFARLPDPASQPLLRVTIEAARGRLDPDFATALSACTATIDAMGVARVLVDGDQIEAVIQQAVEGPRRTGSLALLVLQMGLHATREHEAALRVADLVWERQHWQVAAYWAAVSSSALGEATSAIAWLNRAADRGFSGLAAMDREPSFDAIRQVPDFNAARTRVAGNPRKFRDNREARLPWSGQP